MKKPQISGHCSRCGDELSADEVSQVGESICAFCDNIRAEALEIHEQRAANRKPSGVKRLQIAAKSSDNMPVKFDAPLLPEIVRPTT